MNKTKTVYEILELSPPVTISQIQKAYRRLAKVYHPDKGGSAAKFRELTDAKNYLLDNPNAPGVVIVEEEEEEFDDYLMKQFEDAVRIMNKVKTHKMTDRQHDVIVSIIKKMSRYDKLLNVFVFYDEVIVQRKTPNGIWVVSVDWFNNIILQIDVFSFRRENHVFRVYKYEDVDRVVTDFFRNG